MESNIYAGQVHLWNMAAAAHYPTITGALSRICPFPGGSLHPLMRNKFCVKIRLIDGNRSLLGHVPFKKCMSPNLVMCTPPSSLIALIPIRRSNPSSYPFTIRASISTLILPYLQHFRVLPSVCHRKQHTCLFTNVCKQLGSTKVVLSYPSTSNSLSQIRNLK